MKKFRVTVLAALGFYVATMIGSIVTAAPYYYHGCAAAGCTAGTEVGNTGGCNSSSSGACPAICSGSGAGSPACTNCGCCGAGGLGPEMACSGGAGTQAGGPGCLTCIYR